MAFDPAKIGAERYAIHKNTATHRPLIPGRPGDEDRTGLLGELAFAQEFNLRVDTALRPEGDKGVDFLLRGIPIDIKTARKAYNLLLEADRKKQRAWIYVLAEVMPNDRDAALVGWAFRHEILRFPVRRMVERGPLNHVMPRKLLRGIDTLRLWLGL